MLDFGFETAAAERAQDAAIAMEQRFGSDFLRTRPLHSGDHPKGVTRFVESFASSKTFRCPADNFETGYSKKWLATYNTAASRAETKSPMTMPHRSIHFCFRLTAWPPMPGRR